ncbi:MAG TPA: PD-(D/E)XK nuclease family protein [Syntrophomonadaceae bacterium]|nr:PD-(D/E)XK nuclease family protein [Syntrophomonadaceae bacterium]
MNIEAINIIREYIRQEKWHKYMVILPTSELVEKFMDLLFDEDIAGALYPKIYTFEGFVEEVLHSNKEVTNSISEINKIEIVRKIIYKQQKEGNLLYLQGKVRYGIIRFIVEAISELKQHKITSGDFSKAVKKLNIARIKDLSVIYESYEKFLRVNGAKDRDDRFIEVLNRLENGNIPFLSEVEYIYTDWFVDNTPIQSAIFAALQKNVTKMDTKLEIDSRNLPSKTAFYNEQGHDGEVRKILHEVIRLLDAGVSVRDIAIVARNPQDYGDLLVAAFNEINVDIDLDIRKPLITSQVIKSIMLWFDFAKDFSGQFHLEILLTNHYLTDVLSSSDYVFKWCKTKGRHTISEWVSLWQAEKDELVSDLDEESYVEVQNILNNILDLWQSLPQEGLAEDIISALIYNIEKLEIEKKIQVYLNEVTLEDRIRLSYRENQAFKTFNSMLKNLQEAWSNSTRIVSLTGVLSDIKTYLAELSYSENKGSPRGIRVLSPTEIRGLQFQAVFILGLVQNQFPKTVLQNIILRDSDRLSLQDEFYLPLSKEIYDREKLLFNFALQASREEIILLYPGIDEDGQPNLPSLFIEDVQRIIPEGEISTPYAPVFIEQDSSSHLLHLQKVEDLRNKTSFSSYEGCFEDKDFLEMIKNRTQEKTFSISSLNSYAQCPMRYFMVQELGLKDISETKDAISRLDLGSLKHEVLARVLSQNKISAHDNLPVIVENVVDEVCLERGLVGEEYPHLWLWELEKKELVENLTILIQNELQRGNLTPTHFEWSFGFKEPFYLEANDKKVLLRGVIDRIDTDDEGHFAVYDYKERVSVTRKDVELGRELQLPIYVVATEKLLGEVIGTSYVEIKEEKPIQFFYKQDYKDHLGFGSSRTKGYGDDEWKTFLEQVKLEAIGYVEGISRGQFPTTPYSCLYCHLKDICLYQLSRIRLKQPIVTGEE